VVKKDLPAYHISVVSYINNFKHYGSPKNDKVTDPGHFFLLKIDPPSRQAPMLGIGEG